MVTVALLAFACCGSLSAQAVSYPADTLTWRGDPPCWSGAGECKGMPKDQGYIAEVSCVAGYPEPSYASHPEAHPGIDRRETVKHETMHVAQLLGGCDSLLALWHRDQGARLEAEVQAACTGFTVYTDSAQVAARERATVLALGMLYREQMVSGELYAAFTRHCHGGG